MLLNECKVSLALAKACGVRSSIGNDLNLDDRVAWLWMSGLLVVKIRCWARRGLWSDGGRISSCGILLLASQSALQARDEITVARSWYLLLPAGPWLMLQSCSP